MKGELVRPAIHAILPAMFWIKLIIGPVIAEFVAVLALFVLVAIFGPNEMVAAQAYADKLGCWVGPIAGIPLSFLGALWIARPLATGQVFRGGLFGIVMAAIDVALIVAMRAPFKWVFVVSNGGKILAALAGGFLASRLHRRERATG